MPATNSVPTSPAGRISAMVARAVASTPARLRLAQAATVVLIIVAAVAGVAAIGRLRGDLTATDTASRNLIRVQSIRIAAVQADSLASESYLLGGQERAESRQGFLDQIRAATDGTVQASRDLDGEQLNEMRAVSAGLSSYVGLVELARANNRQGFPVGAAYQRQANALLTSEILTSLDIVEQGVRDDVNDRLDRAEGDLGRLIAPLVVAVIGVALGGWYLARRFRRLVNPSLLAAGAVLVVLTIAVGARGADSVNSVGDAVGGPLRAADLAAQARASVFDARSQEALTLINRGNGAANEAKFADAMATAAAAIDTGCAVDDRVCDLQRHLSTYASNHAQIRQLDDAGGWDQAVSASLGLGDDAAWLVGLEKLLDSSGETVALLADSAAQTTGSASSALGRWQVFVVLGGLLATLLAGRGYAQRLAEYR